MNLELKSRGSRGAESSRSRRHSKSRSSQRWNKWADTAILFFINAVLFSVVFLPKFGIKIADQLSISFAFIFSVALIISTFLRGKLKISAISLGLYCAIALVAVISYLAGAANLPSANSLCLLLVVYAPLIFHISRDRMDNEIYVKTIYTFTDMVVVLGGLAILQFFVSIVYRNPIIYHIQDLVPPFLRNPGNFNNEISFGNVIKSNGFFQNEPSSLSAFCCLGLLIEMTTRRRIFPMSMMVAGALFSFSGTGIFILIAGLAYPKDAKSMKRMAVVLAAAGVFFLVAGSNELFAKMVARLNEFGSPGSSAYARFVAPTEVVMNGFRQSFGSIFWGHGPGTITRAIQELNRPYEIHDPTWAKMMFEYGILGAFAISSYFIFSTTSRAGVFELQVALIYAWFASGGQLLSQGFLALPFILMTFWSRRYAYPHDVDWKKRIVLNFMLLMSKLKK